MSGPKVLVFDIETSKILAAIWAPGKQYVRPNQIRRDWALMCWAAKWLGEKEIFSMDNRKNEITDDKKICLGLSEMLDEADIVITKNGQKFDIKKLVWRMMVHKIKPFSPVQHIDTERLIRGSAAPSSTKLEFLNEALELEHQKSRHVKFPGDTLWDECEAGNKAAWDEMVKYNKKDVLATEDLYERIQPYSPQRVKFNLYRADSQYWCNCGSDDLVKKGFVYTKSGKFQQFRCKGCGSWHTATGADNNLMSELKRWSLKNPEERKKAPKG
jgi:DNA polymerase elongation subunit (family B)